MGYKEIMSNKYKGAPKGVLKVLARKSGNKNRFDKVQHMLHLLSALACSFNHISAAEIGAVEKILKQAEKKRGPINLMQMG